MQTRRWITWILLLILVGMGGSGVKRVLAGSGTAARSGWNGHPAAATTNGLFVDSGQRLGNSDSWRVALGDVDGDGDLDDAGDLDAFVTNQANRPNNVWLNQVHSGPRMPLSPASLNVARSVGDVTVLELTILNNYAVPLDFWAYVPDTAAGTERLLPFDEKLRAIPLVGSGVPWLTLNPTTGAIPASSSTQIEVTFDATGLDEGVYHTQIAVADSSLANELLYVPVRMIVGLPWNQVTCDVEHLIAALNIANANGVADTLELTAGCTFTLTETDNDTDGPNGLPSITSEITVNGNGATIEQHEVEPDMPGFRIWHVAPSGDLTLNQLTVRRGRGTWEEDALGGHGILNRGTLTVVDTTLRDNRAAVSEVGGNGAALHNLLGGHATLIRSRIIDNGVDRHSSGGGLYNSGTMTVTECTVTDNYGGSSGGGIANDGTLNVVRSTLSSNSVYVFYGAWVGTGGGIHNEGSLTLADSTVSGNVVAWDSAGIHNSGTAELINSTIAANRVEPPFPLASQPDGERTHSALGGDKTDAEGDPCNGICNAEEGTLTLRNTIVTAQHPGVDCVGELASLGYNLADDSTCSLDQPTDQPNTDPLLGLLQNNGGPTETHALGAGSPAIDHGSCPTTMTDQRGLPRHIDAPGTDNADDGCDVGALEAQTGAVMGRVAGTVTAADTSNPLAATVALLPTSYSTTTDPADGTYAFWWATGTYSLRVSATDYATQTAAIEIVATQVLTQNFALAQPDTTWLLYLPLVLRSETP